MTMIAVFGSINLDQIGGARASANAWPNDCRNGFHNRTGRQGSQSGSCTSSCWSPSAYGSMVGNDMFADEALSLLRNEGVELRFVSVTNTHTGIATIFVDEQGENAIGVLPGANGLISYEAAEEHLRNLNENDILLLKEEVPSSSTIVAMKLAAGRRVTTILNTAPFLASTPTSAKPA